MTDKNRKLKQEDAGQAEKPLKSGVLSVIIPVISLLLIFAALFVVGITSRNMTMDVTSDVLIASAKEQADTLDATWDGQIETLDIIAAGLAETDSVAPEAALSMLQGVSEKSAFLSIAIAYPDGTCYIDSEAVVDVSDREYFLGAMDGHWAVQRVQNSRSGNGALIVLAVPIVKDGSTVGILAGCYTEAQLARLVVPEIFNGEAYSFICRENGVISVGAESPNSISNVENVFDTLADAKLENDASADRVRSDIANGESGMIAYEAGGEKRYAVYVPLDLYSATGERLVIVNIVPARLTDAYEIQQFSVSALMFVLVILAATLTFAWFYNNNRKAVRKLAEETDKLRVTEEQNRIAIAANGIEAARYDLRTDLYYSDSPLILNRGFASVVPDVPETFIRAGLVAPECMDDCRTFFERIRRAEDCSVTMSMLGYDNTYRWYRQDATIVHDSAGRPYQAIIAFRDMTDEREKAAVFTRWQQSIEQRDPQSYTLFRCNLSKTATFDRVDGSLLTVFFSPMLRTFNERTQEYAGRFVHLDDFDAYVALLNSEYLLSCYYRGKRREQMEYRERVSEDVYRWLRVTIELIQYPDSNDIGAFMMYEDISEIKEAELAVPANGDLDPLTGVLNRAAFITQFDQMLSDHADETHVLMMVDLDGFKLLNDTCGHAVGDQALEEIGQSLQSVVRGDDLVGRIGGDEFLIALKSVPNLTVAEKKAMQIQTVLRRVYSLDVQLTGSIGITFYPEDGNDFSTLYHYADVALYAAKESGKDAICFYKGDSAPAQIIKNPASTASKQSESTKQRMLVVEDDSQALAVLDAAFADRFHIDICGDETTAMIKMRRYGISLSVILLSLDMLETDGLSLIDRIRASAEINPVPVIAMTSEQSRWIGLEAIKRGAFDMITRPIDSELITVRVKSAISKVENDRLRAQNAYLQLQNGERSKYRTIFENSGTVVVEYDWLNGRYSYDPIISDHIYGRYDERPLWQILLSDMVADSMDVKAMQEMTHSLAMDRNGKSCSMNVRLKKPNKSKHWFSMNAFRRVDDRNLTNKIIITFVDINAETLFDEKLRYQAEHDTLTGLLNRNAFIDCVDKSVKASPAGSYILFCCDIDHFRLVNERNGRAEGDRLLKYAAERFRVYAESLKGFAGRLSNDIFAVLAPNSSGAVDRAALLVAHFFDDYPSHVKVTGRAGAYVISDPDMDVDTMLDCAAIAKDSIRGKYNQWLAVYDDAMDRQSQFEKDISDRMEDALNGEEFVIYFQPQFHHATGQLVGAESLVRWNDPQHGLVSPGVFIPIFEKNGFVTKLDEYVWDQTAQYLDAWIRMGYEPVPVSVNVSREDMNDPLLCSKLQAIVKKHGVPIDLFRLEITESLFLNDTERLIAVVDQLHEAGFLIEMDDFGNGYSSLNILKDVPADFIKLDMSFFSGQDKLGRGGMIINAVLRMARWLNTPVIAEGVEKIEQADFLLGVGCPVIQGYLYEKPMPAHEFEGKYMRNQATLSAPHDLIETNLNPRLFWDPSSSDSQVFNYCIGPAAVIEYHNGMYELIRMNRRFMNELRIKGFSTLQADGIVWLCEADQPIMNQAVLELTTVGRDAKADVHCAADDMPETLFRMTLRLLAKSDDRSLIFIMLEKAE